MNWKSYCFIILGAIVQAIGVALLKKELGTEAEVILVVLAFALMVIGFPLYSLGLKKIKLSVAQPLFSSTLFLTCTLLSIIALHEMVQVNQIVGIAIILMGVVVAIPDTFRRR